MKGDNIMAKKKTVVDLNKSPMRDEAITGDVVIQYEGIDRYGTSETNQIDIKTAETICWHDITVDYHKPEPETVTIPVYTLITSTSTTEKFDDAIGIAGEAILIHKMGYDDYEMPVMWWGNENGTINRSVYGNVIIDREGDLGVTFYMPSAIPDNADRIIILLYTR